MPSPGELAMIQIIKTLQKLVFSFENTWLPFSMLSEKDKNIILNTLRPQKLKSVGVFGSFSRNEEKETSDIDLLVEFEESPNLLELIGLEQRLSDLLRRKVDLITKGSLSPILSDYVEKDLIPLL